MRWGFSAIVLVVLVVALLVLGGCSTGARIDSALSFAAESALETSRYGINAARWEVCAGARVGALMVEFKTTEERAAWELFCESYWADFNRELSLPGQGGAAVSENSYEERLR